MGQHSAEVDRSSEHTPLESIERIVVLGATKLVEWDVLVSIWEPDAGQEESFVFLDSTRQLALASWVVAQIDAHTSPHIGRPDPDLRHR
jgi:hypothetical protein